jgi:hypothetical protein
MTQVAVDCRTVGLTTAGNYRYKYTDKIQMRIYSIKIKVRT